MKLLPLLSFLLLTSCSPRITVRSGSETVVPEVTAANVSTFYRSFLRLTEKPVQVSDAFSDLCRVMTPADIENFAGPHAGSWLHVYLNSAADRSRLKVPAGYDENSIIVKEKQFGEGSVTGVAGMIKRPPGYDSSNGDWEYFYADRNTPFTSGRLPQCVLCHHRARDRDYVFDLHSLVHGRQGDRR